MLTFKELHDTLQSLKKGRAHRPVVESILDHTLEGLVQLEADFHTLCREVASLSQMSNGETTASGCELFLTAEEFQRLIDRRDIPQEWYEEEEEYPF